MSKKATIQDIADLAEVGAGTVSRVINDHPNVSARTRKKVLDAMDKLEYRPSFAARHMRLGRSGMIGLLTDQVTTTPYAVDIIRGAQDVTAQHDKILTTFSVGDDLSNTEAMIETMLEREVEGIIYAAMWHHPVRLPENINDVPTILVNCYSEQYDIPAVVPDEFWGGYSATKHLIEQGHHRIGFINIEADIPASVGRLSGYQQALVESNIPYDIDIVRGGSNLAETGYRSTFDLVTGNAPVTAIFAGSDRIAVGVYDAVKEVGLQIPKDIAVIGFDNIELIATSIRPRLSTIQLPHYEMGVFGVKKLIQLLNGEDLDFSLAKIACPPIIRKST